jgi:glycosyltransferase involved in cell wall biosynthesis
MMRMAYVCADPGVPVFGTKGCSVHVQETIRALRRNDVHVTLYAARLGGDAPEDLHSVPVRRLPTLPRGDLALREQAALSTNRVLVPLLERDGPFDAVYERYSLWSHAAMTHARVTGIPGLLEVNAPLIEEQAKHRGLVDRRSAEHVARRAFGAASALLAVSRNVAEYLRGFPAARGRIHIVPNGVNPERFRPGLEPAWPAPPGSFTVGFVGTLKPWHGLPTLVEAFARLHRAYPESRLLIVGEGPERSTMLAALAAHGLLKAAHFTGAVAHEAVPTLLAAMDVAVAPYPNLDECYFSPLKLFEYMAAGVPVVASRIGQIPEVIDDGVNGLLCPPGDASALAASLYVLRSDPAARKRLAENAREQVLRRHTWEAGARRICALAGRAPLIKKLPKEAAG